MKPGEVRYSLMCNAQGGILDDVLVYCHARNDHDTQADQSAATPEPKAGADPLVTEPLTRFGMVVNASNREKIVAWLDENQPDTHGVTVTDLTTSTAMIAVQGPKALELVRSTLGVDGSTVPYYHSVYRPAPAGDPTGRGGMLVSRTGYTGEDGVELIVPAEHAAETWVRLEQGRPGDWRSCLRTGRAGYVASRGRDAAVRSRTLRNDRSAHGGSENRGQPRRDARSPVRKNWHGGCGGTDAETGRPDALRPKGSP